MIPVIIGAAAAAVIAYRWLADKEVREARRVDEARWSLAREAEAWQHQAEQAYGEAEDDCDEAVQEATTECASASQALIQQQLSEGTAHLERMMRERKALKAEELRLSALVFGAAKRTDLKGQWRAAKTARQELARAIEALRAHLEELDPHRQHLKVGHMPT